MSHPQTIAFRAKQSRGRSPLRDRRLSNPIVCPRIGRITSSGRPLEQSVLGDQCSDGWRSALGAVYEVSAATTAPTAPELQSQIRV